MQCAAAAFQLGMPGLDLGGVVLAVAPTLDEHHFRTLFAVEGVRLIKGATYDVMANADLALVTSGTATLETGLFGTPMVVVYKTSWLTYLIGRLLIHVDNIGLVNIVAGKQIVPEFIQDEIHTETIAQEAAYLLEHQDLREKMILDLKMVQNKLGESGASLRAAEAVLKILK